jgi:hypothetical protein
MQVINDKQLGTKDDYKKAIMSTVESENNEDYDPQAIEIYTNELK